MIEEESSWDEETDEPDEQFAHFAEQRWLWPRWIVVVLWAFVGGIAGLAVIVRFVGPKPPLVGPIIVGLVSGVSAALLPPRRRWVALTIRADDITLSDNRGGHVDIAAADVRLISGEKGPAYDGGDLFTWKWLSLTTCDKRRFRCRFGPEVNAAAFKSLVHACPQALGVSADGSVTLGAPRDLAALDDWIRITAASIRTEFWSQGVRAFWRAGVGAILAGVMILGAWQGFLNNPKNPGAGQIGMYGAVAAVISAVMASLGLRRIARGIALSRRIRATQAGQPLDVRVLEVARDDSKPDTFLLVLTIISFPSLCIPFGSLLFTGLVLFLVRRQNKTLRALALATFILSLLSTAFLVVMLLWGN